jgi:hypothetical protein
MQQPAEDSSSSVLWLVLELCSCSSSYLRRSRNPWNRLERNFGSHAARVFCVANSTNLPDSIQTFRTPHASLIDLVYFINIDTAKEIVPLLIS